MNGSKKSCFGGQIVFLLFVLMQLTLHSIFIFISMECKNCLKVKKNLQIDYYTVDKTVVKNFISVINKKGVILFPNYQTYKLFFSSVS